MMFEDDPDTIEEVLRNAQNIYSLENGERILLVFEDGWLVRTNPFGGLAKKPLADIHMLSFDYHNHAWIVHWRDYNGL